MGGGSDVYQTNVQVEGIDESDIVKTDGENIYFYRFDSATGNSQIAVVRASDLKLLSKMDLGGYYATEIYLSGDQLITVRNAMDADKRTLPAEMNKPVSEMTDCEFDVEQPETASSSSGVAGGVAAEPGIAVAPAMPGGRMIAPIYAPSNLTEAVVYDVSDPRILRAVSV